MRFYKVLILLIMFIFCFSDVVAINMKQVLFLDNLKIIRPVLKPFGTNEGDIYSFGIIIHEIFEKNGLFYRGPNDLYTVEEKLKWVIFFVLCMMILD